MTVWENARKQFVDLHNRDFVNCEDDSEREELIRIILSLTNSYDYAAIELALGFACRNLKHPRHVNDVLHLIKENITKV